VNSSYANIIVYSYDPSNGAKNVRSCQRGRGERLVVDIDGDGITRNAKHVGQPLRLSGQAESLSYVDIAGARGFTTRTENRIG